MTDDAEAYKKEWATKSGRAEREIYVPYALDNQPPPEMSDPVWCETCQEYHDYNDWY